MGDENSPSVNPIDKDRAAVLEVVQRFDRALDHGDFDEVGRLCLDDFVFFGSGEGEESLGPAGLSQMLSGLRAGVAVDMLNWDLAIEDGYSISVRGESAVVTGHGRFRLDMRGGTRTGRYLLTYVLHRTNEGWRLWAFHGSEPQPW